MLVRCSDRDFASGMINPQHLRLPMYQLSARTIFDGHGDRWVEHIWLGNLVRIIDCCSSIRGSMPSIHSMRLSSVLNATACAAPKGVNTSGAGPTALCVMIRPMRCSLSIGVSARISLSLTSSSQIRAHPKRGRAYAAAKADRLEPMLRVARFRQVAARWISSLLQRTAA